MESGSSCHQLINDLSKATDVVRSLYQQANNQYSVLKRKGQQLKNQLQDDVSLHLELLRNREVWLLDQVDILLQLKEESLEGQQKELFVLLAKLEIYLELLQTTNVERSAQVGAEVNKLISSIKSLDINVHEPPVIGFLANNFSLTDAIKNYGCIAEEQPEGELSASQETHNGSFQVSKGHFSAMSDCSAEDWLVPRSINEQAPSEQREPTGFEKFFKSLAQSDYKSWLYKEDHSINVQTAITNFCEHFREVTQEPAALWLSPDSVTTSSVTPTDHTYSISHHMSEPSENWLLHAKSAECRSEPAGEHEDDDMEYNMVAVTSEDTIVEDGWILSSNGDGHSTISGDSVVKLSEMNKTCSSVEWPPTDNTWWIRRLRKSLKNSSDAEWLLQSGSKPEYCDWLSPVRCTDCPGDNNCPRETMKVFLDIQKTPMKEWLKTATDW